MQKTLSKSTLAEIEAGKAALARKKVKPDTEATEKPKRRKRKPKEELSPEQLEDAQNKLEERMQGPGQTDDTEQDDAGEEPKLPDVDADIDDGDDLDAIIED